MIVSEQPWCLEQIVLQPTTLCDLNCAYCYLPQRKKNLQMPPEVTWRLAEVIPLLDFQSPLGLIWHGGEPLLTGAVRFEKLLDPLRELQRRKQIRHYVQTNGTHINDEWCDLFRRHEIQVGLSIDGPAWTNRQRVDWQGKQAFERIMAGAACLKTHGLEFKVIAVISRDSLRQAKELYAFFRELGCNFLGINVEEKIGAHLNLKVEESEVARFWEEFAQEWCDDPSLEVREFADALYWMNAAIEEKLPKETKFDIFPSIAWNGDIVLLSPELLGATKEIYGGFSVGNILHEDLRDILTCGRNAPYVTDYLRGVDRCRETCQYFSYCRGGQAANKIFELGTADGTETDFCRYSKQRSLDALLKIMERG
jgi:uncharacterized protein